MKYSKVAIAPEMGGVKSSARKSDGHAVVCKNKRPTWMMNK